jgi:membrane-bound metal-dependent hydrolase YbcI (DUF457 family)
MATATAPGYRTSYTVRAKDRSGEHEGDMEGTTHASTGLLLGAGVALLTSIGTHAHGAAVGGEIGRDLLYGVLVAGFALLPDADHPKATFAYSAGALSHGTSHLVAVLFGGHRQGFHSLFGIAVMSLITASCADWWPNKWALAGLALFIAVCVVAGLKATGFLTHGGRGRRHASGSLRRTVIGCGVAALAVVYARPDLWWLVAMGMALHVLEDEFSGHGCALLWPVSRKRFGGDGKQPARRSPSPGRRPKSGYQKAKARAARGPVAPKGSSRPPKGRTSAGPLMACPECWVGECESCKGKGCGCPQPATSHPARRKPKAATAESARDWPEPRRAEDDVPPF